MSVRVGSRPGGAKANGASLFEDAPFVEFVVENYFFASSTDTLRKSFSSLDSSSAALRARVPAALLFFFNLQICIGHKDVNLFFDLVNQLFHKLLRLIVRHSEIHGGNRNSTFLKQSDDKAVPSVLSFRLIFTCKYNKYNDT